MYEKKPSLILDKSKKNRDRLEKVRSNPNYGANLDEITDLFLETIIDCYTYEDDFRTFFMMNS